MRLPEYEFACPHCWQPITALREPDDAMRRWVIDCSVCCRAVQLELVIDPWTGRESLRIEPG